MRRRMKKLIYQLSPTEYDNWFKAWFDNYKGLMSRKQIANMLQLFKELKEVQKCLQ